MQNRRKYTRFSATAFLNRPVLLSPLPPFFGHRVKGKLIDLSAGGMAILIDEIIPQGSKLNLLGTFPDRFKIECIVDVKHVIPRNSKFVHGIEFLNLPALTVEKIEKMSADYIDCENRIAAKISDVCKTDCAFFTLCIKTQKINPVFDPNLVLELAFKSLEDSPLRQPTPL